MLLQTNSYIVPKDKRTQHKRLVQRFRQTLARLGCDHFESYEQVGANWSPADTTGRFVQLMRFRDRKHQLAVQAAERNDATAQGLIKEFCELINFPYQQQQGLFAVGFYHSLLPSITPRLGSNAADQAEEENGEVADDEPAIESELDAPLPSELSVADDKVDHTADHAADHAGEHAIDHVADHPVAHTADHSVDHTVDHTGDNLVPRATSEFEAEETGPKLVDDDSFFDEIEPLDTFESFDATAESDAEKMDPHAKG
jgi:hypothetical protein